MENYFRKRSLLPAIALLGGLVLTACVNNDYDLNEVDSTVGIGGDGLELPASSTDTIKLVDVLDINDDDCVKVMPNGDYVFEQVGDDVEPSYPEIDRISVQIDESKSHQYDIPLVPTPVSGSKMQINVAGDMQTFGYDADAPSEIEHLTSADTDAPLSFTLGVSALNSVTSSVDKIEITFPSYMTLSDVRTGNTSYELNGSKLTLLNVPTSSNLTVSANVSKLVFGVDDGSGNKLVIDYNTHKVALDGKVHVAINTEIEAGASFTGAMMKSSFNMNNFTITSVLGRFNPKIDLTNLGDVEVTGVPDFLTDGNVCVDLYNPQILLTVTSDLSMGGYVSGTLKSWKNGSVIKTVTVPEMKVNAGGTTNVCICRNSDGVEGYDVVQPVSDLSSLIETIPDKITFDADVRADYTQNCDFELGNRYSIQPKYSVVAPIAFAQKAKIVYKDSMDGWNENIKDYELSDNSYISVTANIENRIPAYLTLDAYAIDVDGRRMSDNDIKVEVDNTVLASADGQTSKETPITVKVSQKSEGALSRLDGIAFDITVAASDGNNQNPVVGQTLNSERHFLIARDIRIKLVGKLIADFN